MMQPMTSTKKTTMIIGITIGATSFLLMLVEYLAFRTNTGVAGQIEGNGAFLLLVIGIFVGIRRQRKARPDSRMTFGQGLGTGMAIAFWTGLVYSLLSYLYIVLLDQHYVEEMLLRQTFRLSNDATAAESVAARLIAELTFRPIPQLIGKFIGSLLFGLIISAICALIFSKKGHSSTA